jgi:amino acid adenylation domain-containing protein
MHKFAPGMPNIAQSEELLRNSVPNTATLSVAERHRVLVDWNRTSADYPRDKCIHEVIAAQARRSPEKVAVLFGNASLTYAELDARSNQLAHLLRKNGVQPEVLVGLCVERSLEMIVALVGILKAGGAYVPLDPSYPSDRIKYVLDDARVNVLITQESLRPGLPPLSAHVICLDNTWATLENESREPVASGASPANCAYVIYTSGSTGKPKGVQLEHRSVVNFLYSMRREPGMDSEDVLVAVTTLSFDIAGLEMYLPLMTGARLVIANRDATYDGRLLTELLKKSCATVMQATPATWRLLLESGWNGNSRLKVLVGGEALSPELARDLVLRCDSVWNMYGPTETTIWSAVYKVDGRDERLVPIGHPIANTSFYILNSEHEPVAIGAEGELYIGGEGLARGYFERDTLTAEKFVADPFSAVPGARMYRTGDLARYRANGDVEFLGRIDQQVKIRGFRIELGEIEAVLEQYPGLRHAVVVAREDSAGSKHLVAYAVPDPNAVFLASDLRKHLAKQLPDYMMPAAFVQLAALPLTPNGKVDRKALPSPKATDYGTGQEFVAPRDEVERRLAALWEEVLGVRPIGANANFFDLGGRSILAARLFMKISREFGKDLPLAALFTAPTVEQLANQLRPHATSAAYSTLVPIRTSGRKPPFFCVHGGEGNTLFLHRLAREMGAEQPFYGLEPEGLDGRAFSRNTVQLMAAHYVAEMRKVQPQGPYHIGGYCFGGIVAFEMAQQLGAQNQRVGLLALFSAPLRFNRQKPGPRIEDDAVEGDQLTRAICLLDSPGQALGWRLRSFSRKTKFRGQMLAVRTGLALGARVPQSLRTIYIATTLNQIERRYAPVSYPGELVLFRGRGMYDDDPCMGWDGLAAQVEVREIGDVGLRTRRDIMNEPLVGLLAQDVASCLEKLSVKGSAT